jgi:hypothetical protein
VVGGLAGLGASALIRHEMGATTQIATVTRLTVAPNPAPGSLATLAATEAGANGAHPAGWVQFQANHTDIGPPVAVSAAGLAITTAAIVGAAPAAGLSAVFTPASSAYLTSATTTTARAAGGGNGGNAGSITITVTVPPHTGGNGGGGNGGSGGGGNGGSGGGGGGNGTGNGGGGGNGGASGTGDFRVTVQPATVTLLDAGRSGVATGTLEQITVSDSRSRAPGWSVWGQVSDFVGSRGTQPRSITGAAFGWVPTGSVAAGATLGPPVAAGRPGLGSRAALLARAASGSGGGTSTLGADLTLEIPAGAATNSYLATLTITYVEAGPQPGSASQGPLPKAG